MEAALADRCILCRMTVGAWADLSMIEPIRVEPGACVFPAAQVASSRRPDIPRFRAMRFGVSAQRA
jgi:hypothetical protein